MNSTARYVGWQDGDMWLTRGECLNELEENLRDWYRDLRSGEIRGVRSMAELAVE